MNPQECVWKIRYRIIMKTILQEKVKIHYSTITWFTNLFLCLKLRKFLQRKQRWTRNGKNWKKIRRGTWRVKSKKQVIDEAGTSGATVHFCIINGHMSSEKMLNWRQSTKKYKGRDVLRGNIVKDDSVAYAVFTEQGSSASQMTAAKIMDIISRLPRCDGQAADAVSAYTQVKMEDAHDLIRIVIMSWNEDLLDVDHRTHDIWVASIKTWSRRSWRQSYGRAQTCRNRSDVWNSQKPFYVHADIRDQNPSLGMICPCELHEQSPNAPKFEDLSQEETEWQEQGPREAAWKLAKNVLKLKEHQRAAFFSPSECKCLPVSTLKPEEREYSGALVHMISKKDLSDAEMDTFTKSCSPTIVITANGEVQTHEEATVYVK